MKKQLILLITFLFTGTLPVLQADKIDKIKPKSDKTSKCLSSYVKMYYFHTTARCFSCYKIEKYTKEAIKNSFKEELESKKLVFEIINIDEKENEHFINKYKLYTKSVVISLIKDNQEIEYNNLEKVWKYLGNKENFQNYIVKETKYFLNSIESNSKNGANKTKIKIKKDNENINETKEKNK